MDVSSIFSISRKQTNTSVGQISDADLLVYLNIVYKEVFSRLSVASKKYTRNTYKVPTTVVWQSEYSIPLWNSLDPEWNPISWLKLVLNGYITYDTEEKELKIYDSARGNDSEYDDYENPYMIVRDWSVFVYPAPTTAKVNWLRLEWKYIPLDLTTSTLSASIKLASEYHDILIHGLNGYIFGEKQQFDKQQIAKVAFEEGMARMISEWWADIESSYDLSPSEIISESEKFLP